MLDEDQILSIVGQEMASSSIDTGYLEKSLGAYLGDAPAAPAGRSNVVSTDIADSIEWILPELMKAFTENNDVVVFDAVNEGDELQAELESKYVYDILMKDNNGFLILHQAIKDALMQRNGYIKIFYSSDEIVTKESFTGLTEIEYKMLLAKDGYEAVEESMEMHEGIPIFDVKCKVTTSKKKLNIVVVPPEEFRVSSMHNSLDLSSVRFSAHCMYKTRSDLVKMGFNKEDVDSLSADSTDINGSSRYRHTAQGETVFDTSSVSIDKSQELVEVSECYMQIDMDEDGISELYKVTVGGWDNPTVVLDYEEIDENPFISITTILMSHKLQGLSLYDRLVQIQDQKTSLIRNLLDNTYLQNNQRTVVVENQVNLDDLLISRPGGIVRAKRLDAVAPLTTPQLSPDTYQMLDYLDNVRAGRSGVSPDGPVQDSHIGDRVGSEGIREMMSAKEELVGLMIRVIAETGIKPICYKIRSQVMRHQDVVKDYKFRGKWIQVDPCKWKERSNTTVRVGTGSGNRQNQLQILTALGAKQAEIKQIPGQTIVMPEGEYNLLDDVAKIGGFPSANRYFMDPASPEGQQAAANSSQMAQQQKQEQDQKDMALLNAQVQLAQSEMVKAQTQGQLATAKQRIDELNIQLKAQQQQSESQYNFMVQQLNEMKALVDSKQKGDELEFKYWDRTKFYELEDDKLVVQQETSESSSDDGDEDDASRE